MALMDVAVSVMANQAMNYLATSTAPKKMGNAHPNLAPYAVFDCADVWVILATGNDGQYQRLCAFLGLLALARAAEFLTNADRVANRAQLTEALTAAARQFTKAVPFRNAPFEEFHFHATETRGPRVSLCVPGLVIGGPLPSGPVTHSFSSQDDRCLKCSAAMRPPISPASFWSL